MRQQSAEKPARILVIAYGNPLRCDDGVAWQAAETIRRQLQWAEVVCVHQLTPELAESVSLAETVIFLDAARDGAPGTVHCEVIAPDVRDMRYSHHLSPRELLLFCRDLYSARPHAFLISMNGQRFGHGEELSAAALRAIPAALGEVSAIVRRVSEAAQCRDAKNGTPGTAVAHPTR
jgi:hydrogenase maturation protease